MLFSGREQWAGLDNIYALTNRPNVPMQLRITMENMAMESFEIGTVFAYYDTFRLEDQVKNIHLFIKKYIPIKKYIWQLLFIKVHILWEGHKILWNLHLNFDCMYCSQN